MLLFDERERKVIWQALNEIGLKSEVVFPDTSRNPYVDHEWVVRKNDEFVVLNAVPKAGKEDHLFWEEWYVHQGEIHHHQLTLWKPLLFTEIWKAPLEDDALHPPLSFGHSWYVYEDHDMSALLLRR